MPKVIGMRDKLRRQRRAAWDEKLYHEYNYYPLDQRGLNALAKDGRPTAMVLMHNQIRHGPRTRSGTNGFRAWLAHPEEEKQTPCDCGWRPELGPHFRVKRTVSTLVELQKRGRKLRLKIYPDNPETGGGYQLAKIGDVMIVVSPRNCTLEQISEILDDRCDKREAARRRKRGPRR